MPEAAPFLADIAEAPAGTEAVWLDSGGTRIRAALTPPGPRGLALILPGRTEYAEKYGPVMTRLAGLGFGSAVIDWRGQGLSDRPGGRTDRGHVGDFDEYARDLAALLGHLAGTAGPRILLGHSMGGCIGLGALVPGLSVQGAVLSAPMLGLAMNAPALALGRLLARAATRLGLGDRRAPWGGEGFYVRTAPFHTNVLTSDRAQWDRLRAHLDRYPELGLGAPTFAWADAAFRAMDALAVAKLPRMPVLGLLGADEALVSPDAVRRTFARLPEGRLVVLDGARHEPLMETPAVRERLWAEIAAFLDGIGV